MRYDRSSSGRDFESPSYRVTPEKNGGGNVPPLFYCPDDASGQMSPRIFPRCLDMMWTFVFRITSHYFRETVDRMDKAGASSGAMPIGSVGAVIHTSPDRAAAVKGGGSVVSNGVGSGKIFAMKFRTSTGPALSDQKPFRLEQTPPPLPSGAGRTDVFAMKFRTSVGPALPDQKPMMLEQHPAPLPSGVGSTDVFSMKFRTSIGSALPAQKPLQLEQTPPPLPSGAGQTDVFVMRTVVSRQTPMAGRKPFTREQYPEPLPSGLGATDVFSMETYMETNKALEHKRAFIQEHFPAPLPNRIGEEDLPGGFRRRNVMSGMSRPLYDLARGIVQIDDVKVLFDARA